MNNVLDLANKITKTNDVISDVENIIEQAGETAVKTVNLVLIQRNWLIGKRIDEEILNNSGKKTMEKI